MCIVRLCRRWFGKVCIWILLSLLIGVLVIGAAHPASASSQSVEKSTWASPVAQALRRVGPRGSAQDQGHFFGNLDCQQLTYRVIVSTTMQTGCFTPTAFGMMDSDSDLVIFNGTDEALPLISYSAHEILVPWLAAGDLIAFDSVATGGSYISLYKSPGILLQDQRNALGQLTAKKLTGPPDLPLEDSSGQRLVINTQTIAFSDDGSWLVAETLYGSFVRINLATLDVTAFARAFTNEGEPGLFAANVAVSSGGRYVALDADVSDSFKVYDLAACSGTLPDSAIENCQSSDYLPFVRQQIANLRWIRHVRFINDSLLSFAAASNGDAEDTIYELAPAAAITALTDYLGLGDSYTSGEGAFDYMAGTDTSDNKCHLSVNSYPLLLTHDLFGVSGGHSVACSGAVINDIASVQTSYRGQVKNGASLEQLEQLPTDQLDTIMAGFRPGYVAQRLFVQQYQPGLVTVSIGGNDIGFGDILQNCVEPHLSLHASGNTCYNTYESRLEILNLIDRTVPRWTALYKQLLAEAPGTRLYAIGYPEIAVDNGNCALNVHLNGDELTFAKQLTDYLNAAIQGAAAAAGVTYVDISQALAGHRLCEATSYDVAVNGLTAGTDSLVIGRESYHPNALGQMLIEQTILRQTHNLTGVSSTGGTASNSGDLLNVPKTGRTVATLIPDDHLMSGMVPRGVGSQLTVDGLNDGLRPMGNYTVRLDGADGPVISTVMSDSSGNISIKITLLETAATGGHTIDVTGENQTGEPIDVTQPIYVPNSGGDSDGDGISDKTDACPTSVNSDQDTDRDGIDDACDSFIGSAPGDNQHGSGPGTPDGSGGNSSDTSAQSDTALTENEGSDLSSPLPGGALPEKPGEVTLVSIVNAVTKFSTSTAEVSQSAIAPNNPKVSSAILGTDTVNPNSAKAGRIQVRSTGRKIMSTPRYKPAVIHWMWWVPVMIAAMVVAFLLNMGLAIPQNKLNSPFMGSN